MKHALVNSHNVIIRKKYTRDSVGVWTKWPEARKSTATLFLFVAVLLFSVQY